MPTLKKSFQNGPEPISLSDQVIVFSVMLLTCKRASFENSFIKVLFYRADDCIQDLPLQTINYSLYFMYTVCQHMILRQGVFVK